MSTSVYKCLHCLQVSTLSTSVYKCLPCLQVSISVYKCLHVSTLFTSVYIVYKCLPCLQVSTLSIIVYKCLQVFAMSTLSTSVYIYDDCYDYRDIEFRMLYNSIVKRTSSRRQPALYTGSLPGSNGSALSI